MHNKMAMFNLRKVVFFIFLFSFFGFSQSQITDSNIHREIKLILKEKSDKNNRKKVRQFLRLLKSDRISNSERVKIYSVLNAFEARRLGFNNAYVVFLDVLLEFDKNNFSNQILTNLLDFLVLEKKFISNSDLRFFLNKMYYVFSSNVLSHSEYFTWKCVGDFHLEFSEDKTPDLYFLDSKLLLFNTTFNTTHSFIKSF